MKDVPIHVDGFVDVIVADDRCIANTTATLRAGEQRATPALESIRRQLGSHPVLDVPMPQRGTG
jgi:hypothetical protein